MSSFQHIASRLCSDFPGVKLLALGQTPFWDEPMKAILRRRLDEECPEAVMAVGIHDADYFSKVPVGFPEGWAILPHNDGSTKDLWVAAGEISRLFGSETIPSRDLLARYGVQLDRLARDYPSGREALVDTATQAWGWRGLVHVDSESETASEIQSGDALPHLMQLLSWGFDRTIDTLAEPVARRARRQADELLREVREYAESHPDAALTDTFREFLLRFYERLLGGGAQNLELTSISQVFRFNKSTARLPRFALVGKYLDPRTRAACQEAYDLAVAESDTYTLDRFCPGAIPFDLVVPGKGRGTVCVSDSEVLIDLGEPVTIPAVPSTVEELAVLVEDRFGPEVSLIGKALTLVLMMAGEFVFVLNEQASAYVPACRRMAELLAEREVKLDYYPILRIDYHTWDSLSGSDAAFLLPGHLASAFRQGEITAREFSDSWQAAVREQESLLARISGLTGTEALLDFLAEEHGEPWRTRQEEYRKAYERVRAISETAQPAKAEAIRLRDASHEMKQEVQRMETEKGEHFRSKVKPLRDRLEMEGLSPEERAELASEERARAELEAAIEAKRIEAQQAHNRSVELKRQVRSTERGTEAESAREMLKLVEYETELARLWMVRDALLVSRGLPYLDHRPSAWWFMLADPELHWFNRVYETAEFRFEEIG
ncbi:MAG: hypothetical protein ACYC2Y_09065 [Armatimonadota bacterium]